MLGVRMMQAAAGRAPSGDQSYRDLIMSHGPVAYWRLDEESGTTAADEAGSNDGTINGDPVLDASPLIQEGTAFGFDGSGDHVDVGDGVLNGGNPFSIEVWIRTSSRGDRGGNYILGTGDLDNGVYLRVNDSDSISPQGAFMAKMDDGSNDAFTAGSTLIDDGELHYLVAVYTGTRLKGYVDKVLEIDEDASAVGSIDDSGFIIGGLWSGDGELYTYEGTLDEVAIYDRALTEAEIQEHYNKGIGA